MKKKNRFIILCSFLIISIFSVHQSQAQAFKIFDSAGNMTTQGVVTCVIGGAISSVLVYDLYENYYVEHDKREETFTESFFIAIDQTRQYLKSIDAIESGINTVGKFIFRFLTKFIR